MEGYCGVRECDGTCDECERVALRGYYGSGIRNRRAARVSLRRRFNRGVPEPVTSRPGARFYVTARAGATARPLLGPYASHMMAQMHTPRARRLVAESGFREAAYVAIGTASSLATVATIFGR